MKVAFVIGVFLITAVLLLTTGCATQRYGRAPAVGATERASLTCDQIDFELGKNRDFLSQIGGERHGANGADVLAFFGDLGIGNDIEFDAAFKSGERRCTDLLALRNSKACPAHRFQAQAGTTGNSRTDKALAACLPTEVL